MAGVLATERPETGDPAALEAKIARLRELFRKMRSVVIGFSGGIDSTLAAAVAHEVLGGRSLAVIACSESYPKKELELARSLAVERGWHFREIHTSELDNPEYAKNAANRCYFCKAELFSQLKAIADAEGYAEIAYGANVDDMSDFRPGHRAARESAARSPLYEAGLTKSEIREAARLMGLPNWNKPAMACLSSRIPYGTQVTAETLARIEAAEDALRAAGLAQFRVRHHDTVARIEVPRSEWPRLLDQQVLEPLIAAVKAAGYVYVTLDLQGFRSGSMNDLLKVL
jgi:uncharacterized protein